MKKMKIGWVVNTILVDLSDFLRVKKTVFGGWLDGLLSAYKNNTEYEIYVYCPFSEDSLVIKDQINGIYYRTFIPSTKVSSESKKTENQLSKMFSEDSIDILHIHGTEFTHSLSAFKAFGKPNKTVISIQGLVSIYAKHYFSNLPVRIINKVTLSEILLRNSIKNQKNLFDERGIFEDELIKRAVYCIGRTDWDFACVHQINPNVKYFHVNESLRSSFYTDNWKIQNIQKHTLFVSQGNYPIKGLHNMIEALHILKKKYPEVKLYVAGQKIIKERSIRRLLLESTYAKYIRKMIDKYELYNNIDFLGMLDTDQIKDVMLRSHVVVLPSEIENSPNSIGEAMLLGVPTVSSYVGGVSSLLSHNVEGYLYQSTAPYMLAHYIDRLFSDDEICTQFSYNARIRAKHTHSLNENFNNLNKVYRKLYE